MLLDGNIVQIGMDTDSAGLEALRLFVSPRLEYIDEIRVEGDADAIPPQRLLQLLASIKKSRPQITIPLIDRNSPIAADATARWILS